MTGIRARLIRLLSRKREHEGSDGSATEQATPTARVPSGLRPGDRNPAAGPEDVAKRTGVEAYDPKKDAPGEPEK
jgi:hypothetical protein